MITGILELIGVTILCVAIIYAALYVLLDKHLVARRTLGDGYLLAIDGGKTICFTNHENMVAFWKRSYQKGLVYTIYQVKNGTITRMP